MTGRKLTRAGWVCGFVVACAGAAWGQTRPAGEVEGEQPPEGPVVIVPQRGRAGQARIDPSKLTDADVFESMKKGVEYLLKSKKDGIWEDNNYGMSYEGGHTAIAVYSLLHAGKSAGMNDPRLHARSAELAPAVKYLMELEHDKTYTAALTASALTLCPKSPERDAALKRLQKFMVEAMGKEGGYTYGYADGRVPPGLAEKRLATMRAKRAEAEKAGATKQELLMLDSQIRSLEWMAKNQQQMRRGNLQRDMGSQLQSQVDSAKRYLESMRQMRGATPQQIQMAEDRLANAMETLRTARERGLYDFRPTGDLSNGQYGTLGSWALMDAGVEFPTGYWITSDRFWRLTQQTNGEWPYMPGMAAWGGRQISMTLAGVASVYVTNEFTDRELRLVNKPDRNIQAGLEVIYKGFTPGMDLYSLYGVERVGLASGLKFFNETNWYKEGAADLLARQAENGSWMDHGPVVGTSYALLFLARGRNPVIFNKLEYPGNTWNARPRDNANLTRWMEKRFEREINWQVVNLKVDVEEWLDAPILMITGSKKPKLEAGDVAKLRAFIEAGGMIFSTADGGSEEFTKGVRALAGEVMGDKYEMRELPAEHAIFRIYSPIKNPPKMYGMSNGVREVWVHSPTDMGAAWQQRLVSKKEMFEIPANLFFYATGKGTVRSKLQPLAVKVGKEKLGKVVSVGRAKYNGNWDPEPGAWRRLVKLAAKDWGKGVEAVTVELGELDAKRTPLVHLTGTAKFTATDKEVESVRGFLKEGGTLFVDVTGGGAGVTEGFAAGFEEMMKRVDVAGKFVLLPSGDALYKGEFEGGKSCVAVDYRRMVIDERGRIETPGLLVWEMRGRYGVVYSKEDVTSGLLGTNTWGILGYSPESAVGIMRNVVMKYGR